MKLTFEVKNLTIEIDVADCLMAAVAIIKLIM
jgi:hypothetical protein